MDRNFNAVQIVIIVVQSLSARRAWIEIGLSFARKIRPVASLSARRAWIEISSSLDDILAGVSLSARRAWIEIMSDRL